MEKKRFSREYTNMLKGIGILLLFMHHVLNTQLNYVSILVGDDYDYMSYLVSFGKVCVSMFFMLSGYGLTKSYNKKSRTFTESIKFIADHILKLYSLYWVIFIIFVPMGSMAGRDVLSVYGETGTFRNLVLDFFGVAFLAGTPSMNQSWWYFSMTLLFYVLFPLFLYAIKKMKNISIIIWGLCAILALKYIGIRCWFVWSIPFVLGIVIAELGGIEKLEELFSGLLKNKWLRILVLAILGIGFLILRFKVLAENMFYYRVDWMVCVIIALAVFEIFPVKGKISKFLQMLGVHSGNIYLFHSFIFSLYFSEYVYGLRFASAIYVMMLVVCVIISVVIEMIKNRIKEEITD